jgi:hypothetical protein
MTAKLALLIVAFAATPVVAHHAFAAEFDAHRPITLKGVVTSIEWTNPHSHFVVAVADDTGNTTNWRIELASPMVLLQNGWRAKSIKIGDTVTVEGAVAKDNSTTANARIVTLADGRRLSAGSSGGDVPPPNENSIGGVHAAFFRE